MVTHGGTVPASWASCAASIWAAALLLLLRGQISGFWTVSLLAKHTLQAEAESGALVRLQLSYAKPKVYLPAPTGMLMQDQDSGPGCGCHVPLVPCGHLHPLGDHVLDGSPKQARHAGLAPGNPADLPAGEVWTHTALCAMAWCQCDELINAAPCSSAGVLRLSRKEGPCAQQFDMADHAAVPLLWLRAVMHAAATDPLQISFPQQ